MNFKTLNKSQIFWKIKHANSVFGVKIFTYFGKMQFLILWCNWKEMCLEEANVVSNANDMS